MARIRTIKPNHVNDKQLSNISLQAHLFWILSWCFSDDEGVMESDPLLLKSQIFPRRTDIRVEQLQQWIDQLVKARFIIPFTHKGEGYLLHRTFKTHQKIDRPQPSKIPLDLIRRILDEQPSIDQPCIVEDSKGKVRERNKARTKKKEEKPDLSNSNLFRQPNVPAFEDVHRVFIQQGGTEEMAKSFFDKYEATGWFLKGSPITIFVKLVPSYIQNWKEILKRNGSSKNNKNAASTDWLINDLRTELDTSAGG